MNETVTPQDDPPEVEQLVDALLDGKLAQYLLDSDTANELVKQIADTITAETGVRFPRGAVRIAFKLLAPMLVKRTQASAGWIGQRLLNKSARVLAAMPGYGRIAERLMLLRATLDTDLTRRGQLESILAGELPATEVENAEGLSQELRIGLRQLVESAEMRGHIDDRFDELIERLNPQPPLTLKLLARDGANRLKFGARRVPFRGRDAEMRSLREFLNADRRFSWWLITGSGGQGKSRMALELCLRAGPVWRAGFLPETSHFDGWENWQPESPTLIVIDYVARSHERVRKIITSLLHRERTNPLDAPVRLLLLERSRERNWWHELIGSDQTGYAIEESQFRAEPIDLGPMTEEDIWQTIVSILDDSHKPLPDRNETLTALRHIDPQRRPLFAAFAADALASTNNLRGWDRERLLRDVLRREREMHWHATGATTEYENLLCLMTMTGGGGQRHRIEGGEIRITGLLGEVQGTIEIDGVTIDVNHVLLDPVHGISVPTFDGFDPGVYQSMTGLQVEPMTDGLWPRLLPLQPDILGEFFVLEHLKPIHPGTDQPVGVFRRAAWEMSIFSMAYFPEFLTRAVDDFPGHTSLPLLLVPPEGPLYRIRLWSGLFPNVIISCLRAGLLHNARQALGFLPHVVDTYPNDRDIAALHFDSAVRVVAAYGDHGRFEEAKECVRELSSYSVISERHEEILHNLGIYCANQILGNAGGRQLEKSEAWLGLLESVEINFPYEVHLRVLLSEGAVNYVSGCCEAGSPERAGSGFALLQRLVAKHPAEPDLFVRLFEGAASLIRGYCEAGQPSRAALPFELLRDAERSGDVRVVTFLAQAAFHCLTAYAPGQPAEAERFLKLLRSLVLRHPANSEIRPELMRGTFNVIIAFNKAGQLDQVRRVVVEARDVVLSSEFEETARLGVRNQQPEAFLAQLRSLVEE